MGVPDVTPIPTVEPPPATTRRRHRRVVSVALVLLLALSAVTVGTVVSAEHRYDAAAHQLELVTARAGTVSAQLADELAPASDVAATGAAVVAVDATGLVDADAAKALATQVAALRSTLDEVGTPITVPAAPSHPGSRWPPTLDAAAHRLLARADALSTQVRLVERQVTALTDGAARVTAAQEALLTSVATVSAQVDSANDVATNTARFAFRDAAAAAVPTAADPAAALRDYVNAGHDLVASQSAEQSELAGPLHDTKVAIEQFARSIDGGVMLDFTWAPTLTFDGHTWGQAGSMAGWTQFWYARGGYATISLTSSVAQQWPASKSLVVHEVGHAISTKCPDLADHSTRAAVEAWATAWAIGMGYTDSNNGTASYGTPPDSLVEVSKACR